MKKIFFDINFITVEEKIIIISMGFISDCNKMFYAEFNDFDKSQINDLSKINILNKFANDKNEYLNLIKSENNSTDLCDRFSCVILSNTKKIRNYLKLWLKQFKKFEFIYDSALKYFLFKNIFANNIFYNYRYFNSNEISENISLEEFSNISNKELNDNALWNAKFNKYCFNKLQNYNEKNIFNLIEKINLSLNKEPKIDLNEVEHINPVMRKHI